MGVAGGRAATPGAAGIPGTPDVPGRGSLCFAIVGDGALRRQFPSAIIPHVILFPSFSFGTEQYTLCYQRLCFIRRDIGSRKVVRWIHFSWLFDEP